MAFRIRFGPEDLLNCRFAVSPTGETQAAVRALTWGHGGGPHGRWVRRSLPTARGLELEALVAVMPRQGYTPDFLFPPPRSHGATFEEERARVRATEPGRVREEIARALACTPGAAASRTGRALLADPVAAVEALTAAQGRVWEALVAPEWPRLRRLLDADIAFHSRRLADGGLARVFSELHPQVTWRDGTLRIDRPPRHTRVLTGGEGVVLVPSVFVWPDVATGFDPPAPAALMYPARGVGELWAGREWGQGENRGSRAPGERASGALVRLMGANRAAVLAALDEPATTSALADRLGLAPSSVSAHLTALRGAGLLDSYRVRHQVLYVRTALGRALLAGGGPQEHGEGLAPR
ncbi:ArsR/SmtB family transcription factor [Streptomyces iconiensis]|uniref:DUF5937 family protein n=1 Tax=Streptomyces iconiensis TaxID=1384038 RepID=A0ABT7A268_9ACTN|nr:DUF5937 family protein [Streptomyces iconiensis]MDJ1135162.1 DUF5937 family protein [Streptomyces iconiensis]